ncbi:hypothetical protein [Aeromicrobium sp. Root472D3]|uniref:hypothetical protein n=1 Tax=Aeromicrobium sp. Root472D3 TaxID=1736540 RepID=UPI0012F75F6E|nr:hypothetical protein [Aeromicrobium sp. Root472D3]
MAMLEFRDAEMARTESLESPMRRLVERGAIALAIGEAMGLSEGQVVQREADLLVAWCTDSGATEAAIDANIGVTIGADVLAGANPGFAESTDGTWGVPAQWIADIVGSGSTFWHRIITDTIGADVLAHEYLSRFAPDILDVALRFLYGPANGCRTPKAPPRETTSDRCAEGTTPARGTASCTGPPDPNR